MKSILLIVSTFCLLACDEHVRIGARGCVNKIDKVINGCFYTLEIPDKLGFYSDDIVISTISDSCGKFQIGDSVLIRSEKIINNPPPDTLNK